MAFGGAVHDPRQARRHGPQIAEQFTSFRSILSIAGRERKGYCRSSIRGNQMNLGSPSASGFADGLGSVFFNAPVPSGCTLTEVESKLKASMRMRTICSNCSFSKTRSMAPLFDQ